MASMDRLLRMIGQMRESVEDLHFHLSQGCSKPEFFESLDNMEALCKMLRAEVIVHSRNLGQGVKKNGEPDRRFNKNRKPGLTIAKTPDLRFSKRRA